MSPFEQLIDALEVNEQADQEKSALRTFHGNTIYFPTGRVYGGQIVAQAVLAAGQTAPDGRLPHSVHSYFVTPGDLKHGICYDVDILRDGHSFSARNVTARQNDQTLLTAIVSYQVPGQEGVDFADPIPEHIPDPEQLPSSRDLMAPYASKSPMADYYAHKSSWDIRHVQTPVVLAPDSHPASQRTSQMVWMRADTSALESTELHQIQSDRLLERALLATGCDQIMMEPALRRGGLSYLTPGIRFATIDHSMWWYRDIDVTRWHLYVQDSPIAGHGRALCRARVYQDGRLVAEITQEALIRVPKAHPLN
jgi:acyl-CoA thioesterase-2